MAFILHDRTGVIYHTSSLLDRPGLIHGFSTRLGGVSEGMFASMNLRFGGPERDDRDRVTENYHRFTAALGADPGGVVLSCQVHKDTVRHVTAADAGPSLWTTRPTPW